jgi:hypothetical protein
LDSWIIEERSRGKVLVRESSYLLVQLETDCQLQGWIFEEFIQRSRIASTNPKYSLEIFLEVFGRLVDNELVIMRPVRLFRRE